MTRKSESTLNQLAVFPWWVILVISGALYVILKFILPALTFDNPLVKAFIKSLSIFAPYLVLLLVIVAIFSLIHRLVKGKMLEKQTGLDSIGNLSWRQFESLVGEAFRRKGYLVLENLSEGADGGVDLRLRKDGKLIFVQCKHWKSKNVGVKVVRELYGIMTGKKANGGILVTYGNFTNDAKKFAGGKPIKLIAGEQLEKLISEVQKSGNINASSETKLVCPKCGSEMVLRTAKKGRYAGKKFWGCSEYPGCRGTLNYEEK
jgi:restriction system protein